MAHAHTETEMAKSNFRQHKKGACGGVSRLRGVGVGKRFSS